MLAITNQPFLLVYVALVCVCGALMINLESRFSDTQLSANGKN